MATLLLSAVGAGLGAGFGGSLLGLSGAVIGRAIGATLGQLIDQRLLGAGSETVHSGRIERFRLTGASEGAAVAQVFGRVRLGGQVIWATRFVENTTRSGGGKGMPRPSLVSYSYSVSLAVALCEGEIIRVGRIWADGAEVEPSRLNLRVYSGGEDQQPDPKIEAVEGTGMAPAYRGIAYVVLEDLDLGPFGNRVPQLSFEVFRPAQGEFAARVMDLTRAVRAVALIPGTGEYALATTALHVEDGLGVNLPVNVHAPSGRSDMATALTQLREELPNCGSVSLVVSWFGSDLRCGLCEVKPKVEPEARDAEDMPWRVAGLGRAEAARVSLSGGPVYGGTPADRSVIEAIRALRAAGQEVMFYPFLLMDQLAGNGLHDPWTGAEDQPALPWRGRITLSEASGRAGSPDRTAAAETEVAAFFGAARPEDFAVVDGEMRYGGPQDWGYRRFALHYAHLCVLAGGVDAFCIASELRGLTQIRGAGDSFPAVAALRRLARELRAILGSATKISYAADWSEYFGYHTDGNVYFHLDPLWADPEIDFIGIDNYLPLADWRDGEDHADAGWGSVYNLDYLKANVAGGEGFDWYYDSPEGEAAQRRRPIEDGAQDEAWIYRPKDLASWWGLPHHQRIDGIRAAEPTDWEPRSKPIRFTEYGCAAIDKGANQPNRFLDPKSSESLLPRASNGRRDDVMQMQYLRAMAEYWDDPACNPWSPLYGGRMGDMARAHVWAWDARPFPQFPALQDVWSDAVNYGRGHWLSGRASAQPLASVVAEICERSGVRHFDVSALYGVVRGYAVTGIGSARAALQPLMLAHGFEALERDGLLIFRMRDARPAAVLDPERLAVISELEGAVETTRAAEAEMAGRVRLDYIEAEGDYAIRQAEAIFPDEVSLGVSQSDLPMTLAAAEARGIAERWLSEARVARDLARFALPPSALPLGAGDVVELGGARYRIDRIESGAAQLVDAVRVEPGIYRPSDAAEERVAAQPFVPPVPVFPVFLDLPLLTGEEVPYAPHLAVTATPWPGSVALWSAAEDAGYRLNRLLPASAVIGRTETALPAARAGLWDRGPALRVKVYGGALASASPLAVLNGANAMAIGDGSADRWEILQFAEAALVAPGSYDLSLRLRGQKGTDAVMPENWPVGSLVVLLNGALQQVDLPASARGLARHYRIGGAGRSYDDPAMVHRVEAFEGIGLRPYAPVHLGAQPVAGGDLRISWLRRTRIDGDSWLSREAPLGEAREAYALRITPDGAILQQATVEAPGWTYGAAEQAADGPGVSVEVAQLSEVYGPGPFRALRLG
ncbi:host specificity protein [Cereibacter changlensis JA139]|uniref:Host specificity protein n=2 Tax=Cereibacter changlensis TaxID=402884 RepID=A0A2T4JYL5_9RHOB|nr:glycoside hydrolase TIM-barrel-like domain-containing protein [Cereibacter changlensis]PTE23009.1 host specificity protein [Cereibacter changlensis JA139]PZX57174.1 putative tail protein [Cereibacter changlensis]